MFPIYLYDMLENAEKGGYAHLISWLPDGKSFKIHAIHKKGSSDEQAFLEMLKKNFGQTKRKSFLRQLQLYGFEHSFKKGPDQGVCKHKLFVRGQREALEMRSAKDFKRQRSIPKRKLNPKTTAKPKPIRQISSSSSHSRDAKEIPVRNTKEIPAPYAKEAQTVSALAPACSRGKKCYYSKISSIPTTLTNLVLPGSESSIDDSSDDELSLITNGSMLLKDWNWKPEGVIHDLSGEDASKCEFESGSWEELERRILGNFI